MKSKWRSEWLDWQPSQEGGSVGFEGSISEESPIIQATEEGPEPPSKDQIMGEVGNIEATKPTKPAPPMPRGVTLIAWNPKRPPVAITQCAVVTDVENFVAATLQQLGRLLHSKAEPRRLRDAIDALEQCGVVVQVRGIGSRSGGTQ